MLLVVISSSTCPHQHALRLAQQLAVLWLVDIVGLYAPDPSPVLAPHHELAPAGLQEAEVLQECDDLLKQLGMKGSLFGSGDNPLLRLQQELQQQQELEEQQQKEQQQ